MSNSVDWAGLKRNIPSRVQIGPKVFYEILWIEEFVAGHFGETRFDKRQILIKKNMSNKLTVVTYLHEITHAVSYEHGLNLTENQVLYTENFFPYMLKGGNIFSKKKRKS